jgi:hypothetical protein
MQRENVIVYATRLIANYTYGNQLIKVDGLKSRNAYLPTSSVGTGQRRLSAGMQRPLLQPEACDSL